MTFRKINDNLIEVTNEQGTELILSREEAEQLGYAEFTYQGKPIAISEFARLINKSEHTVQNAVREHKFATGEQIIAYYAELDASKITYKGKPITVPDFAELIGKSKGAVQAAAQRHKLTTGEQIIAYYNRLKRNKLTYQGKSITMRDFAKLIGKSERAIQNVVCKYKFTTGEQIIDYCNKLDASKFTYKGGSITISDFAKLIGRSRNAVQNVVRRCKLTTGEQIIDYYAEIEQNKKLTYQDKPITMRDFARLINKSERAVQHAVYRYEFTTGEQIIAFYDELEQGKKLTYQGRSITLADFAKLIDKSRSAVQSTIHRYKFTTGEQIIDYYTELEQNKKLTYQDKSITVPDFARMIGKSESTVATAARKHGLKTGEQIIAYYQSIGKL